jgi:hypothetical protein
MKIEKIKPNTLLNELAAIKSEIKKVSMIVESRLIGLEKPTKEEIKAIKKFEIEKKKGKLKLIPLEKIK